MELKRTFSVQNQYEYDANGNLTKNISSIQYNSLNLSQNVLISRLTTGLNMFMMLPKIKPAWIPTEMAAFTYDLEYDAVGAKGVGGVKSKYKMC